MPSTILSDNGVTSGTAGIKTTGSNDGQLALQTTTAGGTATTALTIDTSQRVGIGTGSPDVQLALVGSTNEVSASIRLNNTGSGGNNYLITSRNDGSLRFTNDTAAAERMRITSAGRVLVGTTSENTSGGVLQVSNGITFPATPSASSDANTLDDYEEGTWTPTITGSTSAGTGTYTFQNGAYTKVGRLVTVQGKLGWSAHTGTGNMRISNLPFATFATAGSSYAAGSVGYFSGFSLAANNILTLLVEHNANTYINIVNTPVGGGDSSIVAIDTAVTEFFFSLTYMTNT